MPEALFYIPGRLSTVRDRSLPVIIELDLAALISQELRIRFTSACMRRYGQCKYGQCVQK
jgi:hypothetical protein